MESNWRKLVQDLGIAGMGYTLAARLIEPFQGEFPYAIQWNGQPDSFVGKVVVFNDSHIQIEGRFLPMVGAFPWGLPVEPD